MTPPCSHPACTPQRSPRHPSFAVGRHSFQWDCQHAVDIFEGRERSRTVWLVVDGCRHALALNDLNLTSEREMLVAWGRAREEQI